MKKLLSIILAVISLTLVISAAKEESWKQIYTASDLVDAYAAGKLVPINLLPSEAYDDTGYYFRVKADAPSGASLRFTLPEALDPKKINTVVIGYRTNYPTVQEGASKYIGIDFPKDNTFNFNNVYAVYYYDRTPMETKNGIISDEVILNDVSSALGSASEIKYIKINPWNGKPLILDEGVELSQIYADIEYIGFFESASDAAKFDYDKYIKFNPKQKTHPAPHPEKRSVPDLT